MEQHFFHCQAELVEAFWFLWINSY